MRVLIPLLLLTTLAVAQMPSDLIAYKNATASPLSLANVDPASARAIANLNAPLASWSPMPTFDLGQRHSEYFWQAQDDYEGVPESLLNFSQTTDLENISEMTYL